MHVQYISLHQRSVCPVLMSRDVSSQVQYSLLDQRPAAKMEAVCLSHGIQLLTYGTLGEDRSEVIWD